MNVIEKSLFKAKVFTLILIVSSTSALLLVFGI